MYQNKDEEIRMKRLKRLPDIARLISLWLKQYSEATSPYWGLNYLLSGM